MKSDCNESILHMNFTQNPPCSDLPDLHEPGGAGAAPLLAGGLAQHEDVPADQAAQQPPPRRDARIRGHCGAGRRVQQAEGGDHDSWKEPDFTITEKAPTSAAPFPG